MLVRSIYAIRGSFHLRERRGLEKRWEKARGHRFQGAKQASRNFERGTLLDFIQIHQWNRREVCTTALSPFLLNSLSERSGAWREVSGSRRAKIDARRVSAVWKYAFLPIMWNLDTKDSNKSSQVMRVILR